MNFAVSSVRSSIGPYRVLAKLGSGAVGDVYLVEIEGESGELTAVVLREVRSEWVDSPELLQKFLSQVQLAATLDHPNIVQTFGATTDQTQIYTAVEHVDGQPWHSARERLWSAGRLSLATHVQVLTQVLAGLQCAHEKQLVHGALSPRNVVLRYDGQIKVTDFGMGMPGVPLAAKLARLPNRLPYTAPECLDGKLVDAHCDVFAVGVMLWEALTHVALAPGVRAPEAAQGDRDHDAPPRLVAACERALLPERAQRFGSAVEFRAELMQCLAQLGQAPDLSEIAAWVLSSAHAELEQESGSAQNTQGAPAGEQVLQPHAESGATPAPHAADELEPSRPSETIVPTEIVVPRAGDARGRTTGWRARAGSYFLAGMTLGLLLAVGWFRHMQPRPPSAATSPPPRTEWIDVRIAAEPSQATLSMDGLPLPGNPFSTRVPADDRPHVVEASGPGLVRKSQTIMLQSAQSLSFELEPAPEDTLRRPDRASDSLGAVEPGTGAGEPAEPAPRAAPAQGSGREGKAMRRGAAERHGSAWRRPARVRATPAAPETPHKHRRARQIFEEDPF